MVKTIKKNIPSSKSKNSKLNPKKQAKQNPSGKKNFKFKNKNKIKAKSNEDDSKVTKQEREIDTEFDDAKGNQADFYLDDKDADLAEEDSLNDEMSDPSELEDGGSELDFGEDDYIESESEEEPEEKSKKQKEQKKITKVELKKLIKKVIAGNSFAITKMIIIFSRITNTNTIESLDEDNALNKPKIINKITKFCVKNLPEILNLKLSSSLVNYKKRESESVGNLKGLTKRYLSVLTRYLKTAESPMISLMFKYIDNLSELVISYKNFLEVFLKISLRTWAQRHGTHTSISALGFVKSILQKRPDLFETALKLFYVNYLESAKAMNWKSIGKIRTMQDQIIDILSLDLDKAYLTIFTFIRKLCLQLRATITDKKSSSIKNIYNWQFVNSLQLWARVVSTYFKKKNCEISLLAYPLIQTIYGVLRLNLVDIFYPLRIVLVNMLNELSSKSDLYIPVSIYLVEILESNNFKSVFKVKHNTTSTGANGSSNRNKRFADDENKSFSSMKNNEYDISVNLKLKKEDFKNYGIVLYLIEQTLDSLHEFVSLNAYRFSFPEMAFGVVQSLKKIHKNIPVRIYFNYFRTKLSENSLKNLLKAQRK